jgi:transcriptional regulator with XRE-family HTH domain
MEVKIMSSIKLKEQLIFLRKQSNKTQEELAQALNVTNQAVSKWESGICCPDINLLPEIAKYFNVSVDELLGYKPADSFGDVCLKIKGLFQEIPAKERFDLAYKLAFLSCGYGLQDSTWKQNEELNINMQDKAKDSEFYKWGTSIFGCSEGKIVITRNNVFISSNRYAESFNIKDIMNIYKAIQPLSDKNNLRVLYALYEFAIEDFDFFAPVETIAEKCKLTKDEVEKALDALNVQVKDLEDGGQGYVIEGGYSHIPAILSLLTY